MIFFLTYIFRLIIITHLSFRWVKFVVLWPNRFSSTTVSPTSRSLTPSVNPTVELQTSVTSSSPTTLTNTGNQHEHITLKRRWENDIHCQGSSNRGDTSPALIETGDSVPRISLTHHQYFHPHSLICYLDLSELTFSQSQGESSLGCVFHELQIFRCSHHSFIHSFTSLLFGGLG